MKENWLYANWEMLGQTMISCVIIFAGIIVITRISGLRTFAKISSFDFASTIAIGSILASTVMNSGQSLLKGLVALGCIVILQSIYTLLARKCAPLKRTIQNSPVMIMKDGVIFYDVLDDVNMGVEELMAKLREANVLQLDDVRAVVFETTGDVSVLHDSAGKKIDERILEGVRCD